MNDIVGVCCQNGFDLYETNSLWKGCDRLEYGFEIFNESVPENYAAAGSVEFCEQILGPITPCSYPDWTRPIWHRLIDKDILIDGFSVSGKFVKEATRYKAEPSRIVKPGELILGHYHISDPVCFVDEWRIYVADGCILASGWYDGENEDSPCPELRLDIPSGWHGTIDIGRTIDGKVALVECHHPYACGSYTDDHCAYTYWTVEGWKWMKTAAESTQLLRNSLIDTTTQQPKRKNQLPSISRAH